MCQIHELLVHLGENYSDSPCSVISGNKTALLLIIRPTLRNRFRRLLLNRPLGGKHVRDLAT